MMYNPCIFEQLPIFNQQFGQSQNPFTIKPQQQQVIVGSAANAKKVRFTTDATKEGLLLTLKKPLSNTKAYKLELQKRILDIKNKYAQVPKYSLVSDVWGNQYYVDVTANIQEKMVEELNSIDMSNISRRLSKESFGDYELELNHDGSVLNITSKKDSIDKNLQFGGILQDFYVKTCTVEDESVAVLKIAIVLDRSSIVTSTTDLASEDCLDNLINWAQESASKEKAVQQKRYDQLVGCSAMNDCKKIQKKKDQEERSKKEQLEKTRRVEIKKQKKLEQLKLRRERELAVQKEREAYETKLVEEQRRKVKEMVRQQVLAERQKAEQLAAAKQNEIAAVAAAAAKEEARKHRIAVIEQQRLESAAKELAQRQKAAELAKQRAIEESERLKREQVILEQQQYQKQLVEEERQRKAAQLLAASQATPVISHTDNESDVDDDDYDMDIDSESENGSTTLRKHSSPLLEEVNDEEVDRYNDSVSQRKSSNNGFEAIIEDV